MHIKKQYIPYLIINPAFDNVATAIIDLNKGFVVQKEDKTEFSLLIDIPKAHRFAVADIPTGEGVIQYGSAFGTSKGILKGELISLDNIDNPKEHDLSKIELLPSKRIEPNKTKSETKKFMGYKRSNGSVGTRNFYLIVPTSLCASQVASRIATQAGESFLTKNIDGIVAIPHTEGCGCAHNVQIDRLLKVLSNFINHPNVGGALIIDLGCEQTNYSAVNGYLNTVNMRKDLPVDWLTIQDRGCEGTETKALEIIKEKLPILEKQNRIPCPLSDIILGTECGASDSYSGITANPLIGNVADKIIESGGSAILPEFTEMIGAEHTLIKRMNSKAVADKFIDLMNWYKDLARKLNVDISDNLVPENIAGGLINSCIKSLGAITKGGTSTIEEVLDYGEKISKKGLCLLQGPGNDIESTTGLASAGSNIICFSTGKGAITGDAIVPVIRISSNTELYERMPNDIDFDAGQLLNQASESSIESLGDDVLDEIISVASGKITCTEKNGQNQFQIWTAGKLSL